MRILMMTNTFTPHVGGVARSVETYVKEFRARGHRVMVVAPEFENMPKNEQDVIRVPALRKFNGSDFSVRLPIPGYLHEALDAFDPEIVHSHHSFMLGATALRVASQYGIPVVFTHHTMYERYTHYVPLDSPAMKRFVIKLTTGYANLCDAVIAPSESIAEIIRQRGIESPIVSIPTGIDPLRFQGRASRGTGFRSAMQIPRDAFLVGHVGRLAPEKNLEFLARAVAGFLKQHTKGHFLVVGGGPSMPYIRSTFTAAGLADRLHFAGVLGDPLLPSAYRAMDVFAFASLSETQGMVMAEAMAAGTPVVAIDAPGAREVVRDEINGRLIKEEDQAEFVEGLAWIERQPKAKRNALRREALQTSKGFAIDVCAERVLKLYEELVVQGRRAPGYEDSVWDTALNMIATEWELLGSRLEAAGAAIGLTDAGEETG
jgi:1,2-diacylglycerol 3-alpha-glucosyltransferase